MAIDDPLKRQFYLEMCAHEHWSTREMDAKIDGMLFERTAISGKPEGLIKKELGKFKPEYEGQMKLYLRYLEILMPWGHNLVLLDKIKSVTDRIAYAQLAIKNGLINISVLVSVLR